MSNLLVSAIQKDNVILVDSGNKVVANKLYFHAFCAEMLNMGFVVPVTAKNSLATEELTAILNAAREVANEHRDFTPMYPGFPEQVKNSSTLKLLIEQLTHYWTGGSFYPENLRVERSALNFEDMIKNIRELKIEDKYDYLNSKLIELVHSKIALSDSNKVLMTEIVQELPLSAKNVAHIVSGALNGENMVHFVNTVRMYQFADDTNTLIETVIPVIKTSNYMLRLILNMYGHIGSSPKVSSFEHALLLEDDNYRNIYLHNTSKGVKRAIVKRLGEVSNGFNADNLVSKRMLWQRVMKMVHPYGFSMNDNSRRALDIIHSNIEYRSFNSLFVESLENKDVDKACELLKVQSDSLTLRNIVKLIRISDKSGIATIIERIRGLKTDNLEILVSTRNGINDINNKDKIVKIAGSANTIVRSDREDIPVSTINKVTKEIDNLIIDCLSRRPAPKGKVATVSKDIFQIAKRDYSETDRVMERGAHMKIENMGNIIRFFQNWKNDSNNSGYVDGGITFVDENYGLLSNCSWDTWTNTREYATYSGDTYVSIGETATEFFDVDVKKLKEVHKTARYIIYTLISYSGPLLKELDIVAGVMNRTNDIDGELYDYRTVKTAFKPTAQSTLSISLMVDIDKEEMIWIDSTTGRNNISESSINVFNDIIATVKHEYNENMLTYGDIAKMWAKAHNANTTRKKVDKEEILALC